MHRTATLLALCLFCPATFAQETQSASSGPPGAALPGSEAKKGLTETLKSLGLEIYGHARLDASHDTARTNFSNAPAYVENHSAGKRDAQGSMTHRNSRFGVRYTGPEISGIKGFANIEIDFYPKHLNPTTETMETQSGVRLRHAYARFDFGQEWSLLAGQTFDVVAPADMAKFNTMLGWGQGNIAFRRPQMRLTRNGTLGEGAKLPIALALTRALARDADGLGQDDGEDGALPDLQARIGLEFPGPGKDPWKFGVSGFYGWREVDQNTARSIRADRYNPWVACLDFDLPLLASLRLAGELWTGRGLDSYRGGIFQSYNTASRKVVGARGGFANLIWEAHAKWRFVLGAGVDDPDENDLGGTARIQNSTVWANVMFRFYKGAWAGLEVDRMETDFANRDDRVNVRVQSSILLRF